MLGYNAERPKDDLPGTSISRRVFMTPKGCVLELESSNNLMIDKEWPAFLYIMNADPSFFKKIL